MIVIAESGATKTNWVLIEKNKKEIILTSGINPQVQSAKDIERMLRTELYDKLSHQQFKQFYFYGAGCSSTQNKEKLVTALQKHFKQASFEIDHDLTAAGRALFGKGTGMACILGTGSNSGIYEGGKIKESIPSLGYLLGDEGSGVYMARLFIRDILYDRAPKQISKDFLDSNKLNKVKILNNIYQAHSPNVYLASLARYMIDRNSDPYFHQLIYQALDDFFSYHIIAYPDYEDYKVGFVGSVAYYNQSIIKQLAAAYDVRLATFIQNPIDGLIDYHLNLQS